jgi:ribosomal protein S18 acetylase RimI-like enzyme
MQIERIRLKPSEKAAAARICARAFADYPMITCYWPDPERRARHLEWYWRCIINYGLRYGEVYTTSDIPGISVWLPPGQTHITTWRYALAGFLPLPLLMGIKQFFTQTMKGDDLVHQVHEATMPEPHWYLFVLAVDPDQQGMGIGSALVQPGVESADAQHLPCYVETHDERNIAFYLKNGFDLVRTEPVPGSDLHFWCFVRTNRRQESA